MRKEAILWSCAALLILGTMSRAGDQRPYLGVSLDGTPLPDLLVKHLQLEPGQGLRIVNIMVGSPAEKAGLDRDDLIIALQGAKVVSLEPFVATVRGAGVGTEVSLEVIHLGQRKTVHLKLEPAPDAKTVSWKYPQEPDAVASWRAGRIFKIGPEGQELTEVPRDRIPNIDEGFRRFLRESYTYHHVANGEDYTITIEGDPADKDSELAVQVGDKTFRATVGSIEALPEKYREPARQAVADARASVDRNVHGRRFPWPEGWGPEARHQFFENLPRPDLQRLLEQKDLALKKLQEQMEQLQQRVKEMGQMLHKSEANRSENTEPPVAAPAESPPKPAL